jgi:RNA-binding protein YlmH
LNTKDREALLKCAQTEEDRLFLAKVYDKVQQAQRGAMAHTHFMDPHLRSVAKRFLMTMGVRVIFDGGYDNAERVTALFPSPWEEELDPCALRENVDYPLALIQVDYKKNAFQEAPTHRDYLGALMNLGIKREVLGDILIQEQGAQIVVLSEMASFLESHLTQVGRLSVEARRIPFERLSLPVSRVVEKTVTVPSLRLDAIVAEGFDLSRTQAAKYIEAGKVYLMFEECLSGSKTVEEGQIISLRGMGRIMLDKVGDRSRKNRLFVTLKKFV